MTKVQVRSMRLESKLRSLTGNEVEGPLRIDRRTKWGNRFQIGKHGTREEVIEKYRQDLWEGLRSGRIDLNDLARHEGRDVVCWCAPQPCHGDVFIEVVAWAAAKLREGAQSTDD